MIAAYASSSPFVVAEWSRLFAGYVAEDELIEVTPSRIR